MFIRESMFLLALKEEVGVKALWMSSKRKIFPITPQQMLAVNTQGEYLLKAHFRRGCKNMSGNIFTRSGAVEPQTMRENWRNKQRIDERVNIVNQKKLNSA